MATANDWITFQCTCGFRLERVPRNVVTDLPRCLGCGRSLRGVAPSVRTRNLFSVRDLR